MAEGLIPEQHRELVESVERKLDVVAYGFKYGSRFKEPEFYVEEFIGGDKQATIPIWLAERIISS